MALIDNLISYWKLDEASGNALDAHGSNALTETSGTIDTASGLPLGNARDFEAGDTEYFSVADNASLSTGDIDWSCFCWVRAESFGANRWIAAKHSGANDTTSEWQLYFRASGGTDRFRLEKISGGTNVGVNFAAINPAINTSYFIAWGHNASTNEIWISVNGQTPEVLSTSTGVNDSAAAFTIGARADASGYWDGLIGHFAFFNRDIRSDLASFYNSGSGVAYPFGNTPRRNYIIGGGFGGIIGG